jgi:hypothetical protein
VQGCHTQTPNRNARIEPRDGRRTARVFRHGDRESEVAKSAKTVQKEVEIPLVSFQWLLVTVAGDGPMLTNRFDPEQIEAIEKKQGGGARQPKPPRQPIQECLAHLHPMGEVEPTEENFAELVYGYPAIGIKKSLLAAGMRWCERKQTELTGEIFVSGVGGAGLVPILAPPPVMRRDVVVLRGASGKSTTSLVYRPYFYPWKMVIPIRMAIPFVTESEVVNFVRMAGLGVGIGSWRIERKGDKGGFQIDNVQKVITEKGKFPEADFAIAVESATRSADQRSGRSGNRPGARKAKSAAR